ncbi:MAG: type II toxin-antitoxin system RelB/DinJ family antitoxin [Defluviitaleaceae bacterium]|nr:type II toxin-antitoxin system RelB/DinJ family antitoxin [Defluviitaleaceae bacterium]
MSIQVSTRIDAITKQQFDNICDIIGISPSNACFPASSNAKAY